MNDMSVNGIKAPTISSSAMLVTLSMSVPPLRKKDKAATDKVLSESGARKGAAQVTKNLMPGFAELEEVRTFMGNVRNQHYEKTLSWSHGGLDLLPTVRFFDYQSWITGAEARFWRLTDAAMDAYAWGVSRAQAELGELFCADDYPSVETLRKKFKFHVAFMPVPEVGDWRVDMERETVRFLQEQSARATAAQLEAAMADVWSRVHGALSRMSERLDYAGDADKKIFRDSLVENVVEIVDLLRTCNITNDPEMVRTADSIEQTIRGVTPQALRDDGHLRAETKRSIDAALKALPSLDF